MLEIRHEGMQASTATQDAYNTIYRASGLMQRDSYYLWLINLLNPSPQQTLLDISCGQGRLVTLAQDLGLIAMGIDFALDAVKQGQDACGQAGWSVGDGEQLPIANQSVDYVTHIGSLEHYLNPQAGACEVTRVLKKDGKACLLLPNAFGLMGNIKYVWRKGEIFDDGQPLQRYATYRTWIKLLEAGGLKVEKTVGYGEVEWPRTRKDLLWYLVHPQKIIRYILHLLTPLNLSNHFVFICSRA
jgi:SAM-dependent methyltransferase